MSIEPRYYLRSQGDKSTDGQGPPQFIPANAGTRGEGLSASNSEFRKMFLQMVGFLEPTLQFTEDTLTDMDAELLSSALSHKCYDNINCQDKFYTPSEYEKVCLHKMEICCGQR